MVSGKEREKQGKVRFSGLVRNLKRESSGEGKMRSPPQFLPDPPRIISLNNGCSLWKCLFYT